MSDKLSATTPGVRLSLWTALREYIAVEVTLGMVRANVLHTSATNRAKLEEQSTRMETEIRRLLEAA